jgi:hypothetical protein
MRVGVETRVWNQEAAMGEERLTRARELEEGIADLASRQEGVVTRPQLLAMGMTGREVRRRLECGRLTELYRGVYRAGLVALAREAEMAAVLACGGRGWVSHRSAASLWELCPRPDAGSDVNVRVPENVRVRRPGIRTHRSRRLEADDVTRLDGLPITSPLRTLLDVAAVAGWRDLERAVARAERRGLVTREELVAFVERRRREPGARALAGLIEQAGGPVFTRSVLEERFRDETRRYRLPAPLYNSAVAGREVDVHWPGAKLVVELDGAAYHRSWRSQQNDRRRDADLAAHGITVIRITWDHLVNETEATMMRIGQALAISRDRLERL